MAQQLTKGMYTHENPVKPSTLFGLSNGLCRRIDFVHNGGWYNAAGEKLGWGDLSPHDLIGIMAQLDQKEIFVVLPEQESSWVFTRAAGTDAEGLDAEAPGVDYIAKKCCYVVLRGEICYVVPSDDYERTTYERDGLRMKVLKREEARRLIASYNQAAPQLSA